MKAISFCALFLSAMTWVGAARAGEGATEQLRLEVDLVDGSLIIGMPGLESVPVETAYAKMYVQLKQILTLRIGDDHETATLELRNGDKLKGVVDLGALKLDTVFGKVKVASEHIKGLRVVSCGGELSAGEGTLSFGGVNWMPWRTQFEVQGDRLVSLPKARPGFNYGHSGNGRGPVLVTNIGSTGWKDYSIECQFCMSGVNPAFNPYGLPLDYRNGSILFHVVNAKESFNERGVSCYVLNIEGGGDWSLRCTYNEYCAVPSGYGNPTHDAERQLAKGRGLNLDPEKGNKFRIDVSGKRIQIWVDGESLVDVQDEKMGEPVGDQTLDHGGVGFVWGMDSMGWIRDFSARQRRRE